MSCMLPDSSASIYTARRLPLPPPRLRLWLILPQSSGHHLQGPHQRGCRLRHLHRRPTTSIWKNNGVVAVFFPPILAAPNGFLPAGNDARRRPL
uniref:Uncharacterized protein n=1 Tax=Arundo donax TaxID=35708 RepID=A0A0A9DD54_ARUDO